MGKWKNPDVVITEITSIHSTYGVKLFGLGDDSKMYEWSYHRAQWQKYYRVEAED